MSLHALVGATGAGKTALALHMAQKQNAQIISMDSRQVFHGFRIGTAQPNAEQLALVKHHLVDFLPPTDNFSAKQFVDAVKRLMLENPEQNYLIVGGTGLYLQALTEGMSVLPSLSASERAALLAPLLLRGKEALWNAALQADPGIEKILRPSDTQRLSRVIEVWEAGKVRWSESLGKREGGIGQIPVTWLNPPREELYQKINARVEAMLQNGWPEEVEALAKTVPPDAPAWQSLGYTELRSGMALPQVKELVAQKTRHYAKRQITWFRHQLKDNFCYLS